MRKCIICAQEFNGKTSSKYCDICKTYAEKHRYQKRLSVKNCKYCSQEFNGKDKQILCMKCRGTKKNKYQEIKQKIVCIYCEEEISTETKKRLNTPEVLKSGVCIKCRQINKDKCVQRMLSDNNPSIKKHGRKVIKVKMTKEEVAELNRSRMTGDGNPMKRNEIRAKVSKSQKGRKVPSGSQHWNWKGNRLRSKTIRSRLYKVWVLPILQRDNFICQKCNVSGNSGSKLEVHHVSEKFSDVLSRILNGRVLENVDLNEFEDISQKVLDEHKNITGITYCVDCHRVNDPLRR